MGGFVQIAPYTFTSFDVPNAGQTVATGINGAGQICGYYAAKPTQAYHAFFRDSSGVIATFDYPGSAMTAALGINDAGQIVGYWTPDLTSNVEHMFIRDLSGNMTSFDVPNVPINSAFGINDSGQIVVNSLTEPGPNHSLLRDAAGNYQPVIAPTDLSGVEVHGLNNNGAVVGAGYIVGGNRYAFVTGTGDPFRFFVPGATTTTVANGINDANVTTGYYTLGYRGGESSHGFVRDSNANFLSLDVPGSFATLSFGINDLNQVVGTWDDPKGGEHAFIAVPDQHQRPLRPR